MDFIRGGHKISARRWRDFLGTKLFQELGTVLKKKGIRNKKIVHFFEVLFLLQNKHIENKEQKCICVPSAPPPERLSPPPPFWPPLDFIVETLVHSHISVRINLDSRLNGENTRWVKIVFKPFIPDKVRSASQGGKW